ncbi:RNA-binding cell elongation regulator Jag/EloR [Allofournierella sp.]|uniref:RNA-binding cell elongation regulator Jag/EloR n=1 Tax=Allofournierella sp. TaxID=1940256 RepID=UPI003AB6509F
MREVIVTGKTVEEATEQACRELGLPREEVSIEILELPTRKLFKSTPAKVRATAEGGEPEPAPAPAPQPPVQQAAPAPQKAPEPSPAPKQEPAPAMEERPVDIASSEKLTAAVEYLKTVFAAMGVSEVALTAVKQGEATILKVEGANVGVLIGHRGETMESLSYLAGLVANRLPGDYLKLGLDVGGYRSKREKDLESLARRIGAKVAKTGRSHAMDPMNPYERRIIHSTIGAMQGVRSESKGEGADRRVVIYSTDPNASNLPERREGGRGGRGGQGGYRGGPRREGGHGRSDRNDRGGKGGYRGGERRSSVPEREFADTPRPQGAEPMAPKRTQLIDDAEGLALYGKVEL